LTERGLAVDRLPLMEIAERHGSRLMLNTAVLAAASALTGFPLDYMAEVIRENFGRKSAELAETNVAVAREAYDVTLDHFGDSFPHRIKPIENAPKRMLMHGNEAIAFGALAGGCRFMSAYPMTPATSIIEWLSAVPDEFGMVTKHARFMSAYPMTPATSIIEWLSAVPDEFGMVTKHAEDEIAAVCMALGASYTGARAMTATSGGGFSLMVEAMGLSGMTEVPLVIVEAQRGGPSTGLPTRTEQSDLLFMIHASQGEFPRIITAPGTIEQCFEAGWRALNLADKYQCPVVVATDSELSASLRTLDMDAIDPRTVEIDRGATLTPDDADALSEEYLRFRYSDDGISPRAMPGRESAILTVPSDEHDESGHINEDADVRIPMMQKRMQKLKTAEAEMKPPLLYGPEDADLTLVTWGSTTGHCRAAADEINAAGGSANVLQFIDLWPMPVEAAREALALCKRKVAVEQNYTGQLAMLIRMTTGVAMDDALTKYDGRPFSPRQIIEGVGMEVASGHKA
jgi:2-oxoglutarate ferredoxin oxidoreductase subunit alpha